MRRLFAIVGGILGALLISSLAAANGAAPTIRSATQITVVERETGDTAVDTDGSGSPADTPGDLLVFHNAIYDATNETLIGRDVGQCTLVASRRKSYYCTWNTNLPGGQISVQGRFSPRHDTTLAITGGTGHYANARGTMLLHARSDLNFEFVFSVLP